MILLLLRLGVICWYIMGIGFCFLFFVFCFFVFCCIGDFIAVALG